MITNNSKGKICSSIFFFFFFWWKICGSSWRELVCGSIFIL